MGDPLTSHWSEVSHPPQTTLRGQLGRLSRPTYPQWKRLLMAALLLIDAFMMLLAMWSATYLRFWGFFPEAAVAYGSDITLYLKLFPVLLLLWLSLFGLGRLYNYDSLFWGYGEFGRVGNCATGGLVLVIIGAYALELHSLSRAWMVLSWVLCIVLVSLGRVVFRNVVALLRRREVLVGRTLMVGSNDEANLLLNCAQRPASGLMPIGFLAGRNSRIHQLARLPELGGCRQIAEVVAHNQVDCVVIASSDFSRKDVAGIIHKLRGFPVEVHVSSGLFDVLASRMFVKEIDGIPLVTVRRVALTPQKLLTKRVFDLTISFAGMVALLSLWIALALLIKLTSPGPVLYTQERIGKGGRRFMMYKFRSMVADADRRLGEVSHLNEARGLHFKIRDDPRVTTVGWWMRKFSVDELPQLLNVLRGEMSLVGPRPPLPNEVKHYNGWHRRRLDVVPGMTGLWQIRGRSDLSFEDAVRLDIHYIENWSPSFDLSILLKTIPVVLFPKGAY